MKRSILALLSVFLLTCSFASHVLSTDLNYQFMEEKNGSYVYLVTLDVFRDCDDANVDFDPDALLGIYHNSSSRQLYTDLLMVPQGEARAVSDKCLSNQRCVDVLRYSVIIELPHSDSGFILSYDRCCISEAMNTKLHSGGASITAPYGWLNLVPQAKLSSMVLKQGYNGFCVGNTEHWTPKLSGSDFDSISVTLAPAMQSALATLFMPLPLAADSISVPIKVLYNDGYTYLEPFADKGEIIKTENGFELRSSQEGNYYVGLSLKGYNQGKLQMEKLAHVMLLFSQCSSVGLPEQLDADLYTRTSAGLYWESCSRSVQSITVQRSTIADASFNNIASLDGDAVFYEDTSIELGNTYVYRLLSKDSFSMLQFTNLDTLGYYHAGVYDKLVQDFKIKLYPNPAFSEIQVDLNLESEVILYGVDGKEVLRSPLHLRHQLDVSFLKSGIYVVELIAATGEVYRVKWIKL